MPAMAATVRFMCDYTHCCKHNDNGIGHTVLYRVVERGGGGGNIYFFSRINKLHRVVLTLALHIINMYVYSSLRQSSSHKDKVGVRIKQLQN